MSIYDFFLILDEYVFDFSNSYLSTKSSRFQEISYKRWSVQVIKNEIAINVYPTEYASKDQICSILSEFAQRMAEYSYHCSKNKLIFRTAQDVATDILDIIK